MKENTKRYDCFISDGTGGVPVVTMIETVPFDQLNPPMFNVYDMNSRFAMTGLADQGFRVEESRNNVACFTSDLTSQLGSFHGSCYNNPAYHFLGSYDSLEEMLKDHLDDPGLTSEQNTAIKDLAIKAARGTDLYTGDGLFDTTEKTRHINRDDFKVHDPVLKAKLLHADVQHKANPAVPVKKDRSNDIER